VLSLIVPPPARQPDPGERLGIDFARMRSAAEIAAAIGKALTAISRGEITPSEGLRLARRKRAGKFAVRKFLVQSRKIPCSEGISADAAPALDGCATLCR
jgi:hypothetical protein